MPKEPSNKQNLEKTAAAVRELDAKLADMRVALDRMEASKRLEFQDQVDVLAQRQKTVARRLSELQETDAADFNAQFRSALEDEVAELQIEIRQVARRIVLE
jgi:hypothetical protein